MPVGLVCLMNLIIICSHLFNSCGRETYYIDIGSNSSIYDSSFLLWHSKLHLWDSPFLVRFLHTWLFQSYHTGSHILYSYMVHAWCVFVAGIHPSRTWMLGSFESMQWNACVYRLDLGLYSHLKEFWGNGVRSHGNYKGKSPLWETLRRFEPTTLHHAGQRAQHTNDWAIPGGPHLWSNFFKTLYIQSN